MLPQTFVLRQPSTAINHNWSIRTGWRPSLVMGLDSSNGQWFKVDGRDDDNQQAFTLPDGSGQAARVDDICQITDDGFQLGTSTTWIRVNSKILTIIAFPPGDVPVRDVTLNDSRIAAFATQYGDGNAFNATPQDEPYYDWIQRGTS